MRNKFIVGFMVVIVLLLGAYLAVGKVLYDQLSDISGRCADSRAVNTPANFQDVSGYWRDDFDFSPYFMPEYEAVRFPSRQEGIEIAGWYVEAAPGAPAVILVHGLGACKHTIDVLTPAGMLHNAGFNVLLMDMRDAGDSTYEDGRSAVGNEEYLDVLGAWDWLMAEKGILAEQIGLLGNSLGSATVLIAFSQEPRVAAVWADSPFDNLPQIIREELERNNYPTFLQPGGIWAARIFAGDNIVAFDPGEAVEVNNGRPMFILHGTADTRIDYHHTLQLQDRAQAIEADNVTFWILDGVEHVQAASAETAEYEQHLITFFDEAINE